MNPFKPSAETRRALERAAETFAQNLIDMIAHAKVDDLRELASEPVGQTRTARAPSPRRGRASSAAGAAATPASRTDVLASIVAHLHARPEGARAETLRSELGLEKPILARALSDGLATEEIRKTGRLRATKYFAA